MKKIYLLAFSMTLATVCFSQATDNKKLVADETWVQENKTAIAVITTSEAMQKKLTTVYKGFTKVTCTVKNDRKGDYWSCTYYYPKQVFTSLQIKF